MLDALKERGMYNDTLIVVTTDVRHFLARGVDAAKRAPERPESVIEGESKQGGGGEEETRNIGSKMGRKFLPCFERKKFPKKLTGLGLHFLPPPPLRVVSIFFFFLFFFLFLFFPASLSHVK